MISSIGSSRNVRLIPSGRDEWSVGLAFASSMSDDDAVKCVHNKDSIRKSDRAPHSLRLDDKRVAYFSCDLYSIPEDEPVCDCSLVVRDVPLEAIASTEVLNSEEFYTISLQDEPMIREMKQESNKGDTETVNSFHEPCVFGKNRNQAWNSDQFDDIFQLLGGDCLEMELDENIAADNSISVVQ